jgi:hypothetical protein
MPTAEDGGRHRALRRRRRRHSPSAMRDELPPFGGEPMRLSSLPRYEARSRDTKLAPEIRSSTSALALAHRCSRHVASRRVTGSAACGEACGEAAAACARFDGCAAAASVRRHRRPRCLACPVTRHVRLPPCELLATPLIHHVRHLRVSSLRRGCVMPLVELTSAPETSSREPRRSPRRGTSARCGSQTSGRASAAGARTGAASGASPCIRASADARLDPSPFG